MNISFDCEEMAVVVLHPFSGGWMAHPCGFCKGGLFLYSGLSLDLLHICRFYCMTSMVSRPDAPVA